MSKYPICMPVIIHITYFKVVFFLFQKCVYKTEHASCPFQGTPDPDFKGSSFSPEHKHPKELANVLHFGLDEPILVLCWTTSLDNWTFLVLLSPPSCFMYRQWRRWCYFHMLQLSNYSNKLTRRVESSNVSPLTLLKSTGILK